MAEYRLANGGTLTDEDIESEAAEYEASTWEGHLERIRVGRATARSTDLIDVPGIGAKKAALLEGLGRPDLASLRGADADDLYVQAQLHEGRPLDKCVLYAFRCAVAYAQDPHPNSDEYRWWFFCDEGKDGQAGEV